MVALPDRFKLSTLARDVEGGGPQVLRAALTAIEAADMSTAKYTPVKAFLDRRFPGRTVTSTVANDAGGVNTQRQAGRAVVGTAAALGAYGLVDEYHVLDAVSAQERLDAYYGGMPDSDFDLDSHDASGSTAHVVEPHLVDTQPWMSPTGHHGVDALLGLAFLVTAAPTAIKGQRLLREGHARHLARQFNSARRAADGAKSTLSGAIAQYDDSLHGDELVDVTEALFEAVGDNREAVDAALARNDTRELRKADLGPARSDITIDGFV